MWELAEETQNCHHRHCLRVSTFAVVDDGGTFICTAQLHRRVGNFFTTAFGASLLGCSLGLQVATVYSLDAGLKLLSQE